ncbi:essential cell division protein [Buchnera aphidicola str. Ak (Acyrthosiphon kondoi)]|uniref:Cell division protein FtsB n=1 Tax=Buchnera aphidicola str. Ak (Acyrthosiphon kondoi) TaxID=1005090 RepID=G2LNC1_9GAMM|nr:septum formation initiator family protein [Buchnera aphidicola]AEO08759.1 essential cell division protein [Buchnera aphidicola str. Ak (Acyrthosiphon kondoi)]
MKILKMFLLFLLCWLQFSLWLGKNGILDYIKIYKKVLIQKKNNEYLDMRNNQITLEIKNFNNHIDCDKRKCDVYINYFR